MKNRKQDGGIDDGRGKTVKRGRVVVKEIGPLTRKGRHRLSLVRYKHFKILKIVQS